MIKFKRRIGDRFDGKHLRKVDPFYKIIPYIMRTRVDSQVYFQEKIYIRNIESFIKDIKKEENINISILHVIIAAMVRIISQKPKINRFISGRKIYARNEISIALAVKKKMDEDTPETTIKLIFKPTDTIYEVVHKVNQAISNNKQVVEDNDTDKVAKMIMLCPGLFVKVFIALINFLDHRGNMPKLLHKVSPFHSSLFITNLGSIGIQPVYHHIYEFGTTSLFLAFGTKNRERVLDESGKVVENKYIDFKIVADERICDGYYYATTFRKFRKIMLKPEQLKVPPEKVYEDNEI